MSNNGTDRDLALSLVSKLTTCATTLESINDTKYAPHITTQPVDAEGEVNTNVTFTVVADHVKSYQWQRKSGSQWNNAQSTGNKTATVTVAITSSSLYNTPFRCEITGLDGTVIYTDTVTVLEPEAEG